jgi:molybdate transport system substrate-binding protein
MPRPSVWTVRHPIGVSTSRSLLGILFIQTLLLTTMAGCGGAKDENTGAREVRVAAASDLRFAFDDIVTAFQARQPGIVVKVTYGSSGNFFAQLSNEAPFDLFLSADIDYPRKLIEQGQAVKESEFHYAVGQIVVWVPNASPLDLDQLGIRAVADPSVRKAAIANPQHAPYGRAAEAALKHYGIYEQVRDRLILGENIAQTAQFVESGSADVGVIALSLARAPTMKDRGRYWEVPTDTYPRLEQGGVILNWAKDQDAARALRVFVTGAEGRAVLAKYGFRMPGG